MHEKSFGSFRLPENGRHACRRSAGLAVELCGLVFVLSFVPCMSRWRDGYRGKDIVKIYRRSESTFRIGGTRSASCSASITNARFPKDLWSVKQEY